MTTCPKCGGEEVEDLFGDRACPVCRTPRSDPRSRFGLRAKYGVAGAMPDWFTVGTVNQRLNVAAGLHPTGNQLYSEPPGEEVCGGCAFLERVNYHSKTYFKCKKQEWTHGPGTDIRLKWAACKLYQPASWRKTDGE